MLPFWADLPLHLNPVIFQIGGLSLRWYSLSYLLALLTIYLLLKNRLSNNRNIPANLNLGNLEIILFSAFLGAIIGGKIGYLIFYDFSNLVHHPLSTLSPFDSQNKFIGFYGLSFHGGLVGAILSSWWTSRKYKIDFYSLLNFATPAFPLGYFWGRLGNFFNRELYGRLTDSPLGMYFSPTEKRAGLLRHPSQLYEALGEGLVLFLILQYCQRFPTCQNKLFPLFLILYGIIRFLIEFFRQPDPQLGFIALGWLTMGQLLCLLMIFIGITVLLFYRKTASKI